MDSFDYYRKAGKIAKEAKEYSKLLVKNNVSYSELAEKIESKIKFLGGEIGFPVNISVNEIAAHDTAYPEDKRTLIKGDVVKIDIGVHVKGYIADTAYTIEVGSNEHSKLIESSREALEKSQKMIKLGATYGGVGSVIQESIRKYGFVPVKNLSGHVLSQNELHGYAENIPNYANGSKTIFEENSVVAVEPFASTGAGFVIDTRKGAIYKLLQRKPIRVAKARQILDYIEKNYSTLPFSKTWLYKKFGNIDFIMNYLEKAEILHNYAVLKDRMGGFISQAENTMIVKKEGVEITTE
ncbi:MAG: type II methionyl aminopeptidase [Candidatus Nanoarchaeia archaeon]|nr:type II methionyl aminopeptidase [Candidatus Nanoarchaeia archaeon]